MDRQGSLPSRGGGEPSSLPLRLGEIERRALQAGGIRGLHGLMEAGAQGADARQQLDDQLLQQQAAMALAAAMQQQQQSQQQQLASLAGLGSADIRSAIAAAQLRQATQFLGGGGVNHELLLRAQLQGLGALGGAFGGAPAAAERFQESELQALQEIERRHQLLAAAAAASSSSSNIAPTSRDLAEMQMAAQLQQQQQKQQQQQQQQKRQETPTEPKAPPAPSPPAPAAAPTSAGATSSSTTASAPTEAANPYPSPGSQGEEFPKTPAGSVIVPCRARGMPMDHNFKTAYFVIPEEVKHGEELICSHVACRNAGIKFRYCAYCKVPVAKRNFRKRHDHGKGGGVMKDYDEDQSLSEEEDSSTAHKGSHDGDSIPSHVTTTDNKRGIMHQDSDREQGSLNNPTDGYDSKQDIPSSRSSGRPSAFRPIESGERSRDAVLEAAKNQAREERGEERGTAVPVRTGAKGGDKESAKAVSDVSDTASSSQTAAAQQADSNKTKNISPTASNVSNQRREQWIALLEKRPATGNGEAMNAWLMEVLAVSDLATPVPPPKPQAETAPSKNKGDKAQAPEDEPREKVRNGKKETSPQKSGASSKESNPESSGDASSDGSSETGDGNNRVPSDRKKEHAGGENKRSKQEVRQPSSDRLAHPKKRQLPADSRKEGSADRSANSRSPDGRERGSFAEWKIRKKQKLSKLGLASKAKR